MATIFPRAMATVSKMAESDGAEEAIRRHERIEVGKLRQMLVEAVAESQAVN